MNIKYCLNSVYNCLPLSRVKLLEDVILYRKCGCIHRVWLHGGHIFISLDEGKKLVTFDSKTADLIQDVETDGCLDLDEKYAVIDVLTWPPNAVLIVLQNGEIQHWQFGQDYKWQKKNELYICKNVGATITSVCLNVAQNSLYWCEKGYRDGSQSFTLYKRPIKEDEMAKNHLKLGSVTSLIKNCCDGQVYPMGHGIAYIPSSSGSVSMCIVLCTLTGAVEVVTRTDRVKLIDTNIHTPVTYGQVILDSIALLHKLKDQPYVIKTLYLHSSLTILQLYSDGKIQSVSATLDSDRQTVDIQLQDVNISEVTGMVALRQCVGIVLKSEIRVYSLKTGTHFCSLSCVDEMDIEGSCDSMFGNQQSAIYTENGLYLIQKERTQRNLDESILINSGQYQSQAIQLSYLEREILTHSKSAIPKWQILGPFQFESISRRSLQNLYTSVTCDKMQKTTYDSTSVQAIEQLGTRWQKSLGAHPTSKLTEVVDPYLREYWKLENMLKDRCEHPNMIPNMDMTSVSDEVDRLLDPKGKLSNSARQTQLLLLSQWFPVQVLNALLAHFDLSDNELSTSQTHKWQCILASETANLAGSCDIPVPLFELITHLLYKHQPNLLTQFLHRSQKVWDKKLGMSAFIRRRQSLLIYERALKCIPEPSLSDDVETAILVHVHVLLKSETESCILKAIRLLLKYKKWSEAIKLFKDSKESPRQSVLLYQMIVTALTQFQVLHKYAELIFPLMPSLNWSEGSIQQENSQAGPPSVLSTDERCVSMQTVKPYLLDSIKQTLHQTTE